ncbi:hypothetical protein MTR67_034919 [Solanum verrucosum]|uniref:Uncharacterized protein n=1 Tax=Solanum verrucosum TaxID=315347 RepID=A0AAF0U9G3_SOLVR|nr:hypothetical protein MTR67_034919 [Solanum verrucosum]
MVSFKALYGRRCSLSIGWFAVGEVALMGPKLVHEAMKKKLSTGSLPMSPPTDRRRQPGHFVESSIAHRNGSIEEVYDFVKSFGRGVLQEGPTSVGESSIHRRLSFNCSRFLSLFS